MRKGYESGFAHAVLITVLAASILAAGGFAFYAFQGRSATEQSGSAGQNVVGGEERYLTINDWRVRIPVFVGLEGVKPTGASGTKYAQSGTEEAVQLLAPALNATWKCEGPASLGSISRTSGERREGPYEPVATKKLGQYTYGLEVSEKSSCTDDPRYGTMVSSLKQAFDQLEQY